MLFLSSLHYGTDYMAFQWASGMVVLSVLMAWAIAKKTSPLLGLAIAYFLVSAIYVVAFTHNKWIGSQINPSLVCGSAFAMIAMLFLGNQRMVFGEKTLAWFAVLNSFYVILGFLFLGKFEIANGYSGFIDYPSINGAIIGCLSGMVLQELSWGMPFVAIAVVLSKSSIPYGAFALTLIAYFLHKKQWKKLVFAPLSVLLPGWLICKSYAAHPLFLNDAANSRYEAYGFFMKEWWAKANHWFGAGPGTFQILGPLSQMEKGWDFTRFPDGGFQGSIWFWIHSDWLQTIFELGIIGFVLALLVFGEASYRLFRSEKSSQFSLLIGLIGTAVFDYPVRYFPGALLAASCIFSAYKRGER